ncbi:hypothetical protein PISMIDRAFT_492011 [Pisolithus microcarpus 441]|uniref:Unplaced genomic scaffold scaffold_512, whole genome shotgun sequence n=1 Tax=Pisolithus microcarpus 441 TaxID=765257 RepID=A0A0C9YMT3_9AGAM|nr:hypothetical protein PISMIDRAFT_492011 [Pisolithus microcarpus 441]
MEKSPRRSRDQLEDRPAYVGFMRVLSNPQPRMESLSRGSSSREVWYEPSASFERLSRTSKDPSRGPTHKPDEKLPRRSHSPVDRYSQDTPVECSRSRSRRHSQGSSSTKPPSRSPFEVPPRSSKYSPPSPELASSSSFPHRVTNAGSRHTVVHPRWCAPEWQAGDSSSNLLRVSRDDRRSHSYSRDHWDSMEVHSPRSQASSSKPRDLGSSSSSHPRPHELSSTSSRYPPRFEPSSRYSPPLKTSYRQPSHLELPSKTSSRHPSHAEPTSKTSLRHSSHAEPPSRHSLHLLHSEPPLKTSSRHVSNPEPPSKTASRHSSHLEHPSGTATQHPEPIAKCPPRLETPSRLPPHLETCKGSSSLLREASTAMLKPTPAPSESRSRVSRGVSPHRECEGSSEALPTSRGVPRHQMHPRRFRFCFFCGREGHIRAQCRTCTSYLAAGRCQIVGGRVVLPTGEEIPREALGRSLQARLDFWALARGPGGLAMQEQSSPSSSQTPIPSRARPEAVEGQLPGSRATRPLSSQPLAPSRAQPETHEGRISSLKVTQPPLSTSETLELDPDAGLAFETLRVAFKALRAAFETLQATFKRPSRPSGQLRVG